MIQSATKQNLSIETIRALAAELHPGELANSQELGDGYFNTAILLSYTDGARVVLKIAPPPATRVLRQEAGLMQIEVDTMRFVSDHTSLPVPRILAYHPVSPHLSSPYIAMAFIAGTPLDKLLPTMAAEDRARVFGTLGRLTAELHTHSRPYFGAPTHLHATWSAAFLEMVRDVLDDAVDAGAYLGLDPQAIRDAVDPLAGILDEVRVPVLLHRDLWFGNIFVDPQSLNIVGLTDWERSVAGDPLMEFVCALLEGVFASDGREAFYSGYGRTAELSSTEQMRVDLYSLYLVLLLIVEGYYRGYRNPQQEQYLQGIVTRLIQALRPGAQR